MKNYPKYIKNTLFSVIRDMAKHPEDFCRCPGTDFTRKRKLPFENILTLLVKMGGHSLRDEMMDCLDFKEIPVPGFYEQMSENETVQRIPVVGIGFFQSMSISPFFLSEALTFIPSHSELFGSMYPIIPQKRLSPIWIRTLFLQKNENTSIISAGALRLLFVNSNTPLV